MYCFHQTDCCIYMNTSVISGYTCFLTNLYQHVGRNQDIAFLLLSENSYQHISCVKISMVSSVCFKLCCLDSIFNEEKKCIQMGSFVWSYNAMCAISRDPRGPSQNGLYHQHCHCLSSALCSKKETVLVLDSCTISNLHSRIISQSTEN